MIGHRTGSSQDTLTFDVVYRTDCANCSFTFSRVHRMWKLPPLLVLICMCESVSGPDYWVTGHVRVDQSAYLRLKHITIVFEHY